MPSSGSDSLTSYGIPLSAIATWPKPNYVHPEKRHWFVPYALVVHGVVTVVVGIRLWVRYKQRVGLFPFEDALIVGGWVFGGAFTGVAIYGVLVGALDRHIWDVPPDYPPYGGIAALAAVLLFLIAIGLTKISNLVFQRRLISRTDQRRLKLMIDLGMGGVVLYTLFFGCIAMFQCSPVSAAWLSVDIYYTKPYKCIDRFALDPLSGALSVFTDMYALLLPNLMIRTLQISIGQKIMLCALLSCNIITMGAGIARTVWFYRLHTGKHDLSWIAYDILIWSTLEMQMAVVCASAPQLKSFVETGVLPRCHVSQLVKRYKDFLASKTKVSESSLPTYGKEGLSAPSTFKKDFSENFSGTRTLVSGTGDVDISTDVPWAETKRSDSVSLGAFRFNLDNLSTETPKFRPLAPTPRPARESWTGRERPISRPSNFPKPWDVNWPGPSDDLVIEQVRNGATGDAYRREVEYGSSRLSEEAWREHARRPAHSPRHAGVRLENYSWKGGTSRFGETTGDEKCPEHISSRSIPERQSSAPPLVHQTSWLSLSQTSSVESGTGNNVSGG